MRKLFATKGEALAFESHTMDEVEAKPRLGESVDRRTLKDVVELWFKLHGKSLTAGEHVYDKLVLIVDALETLSLLISVRNYSRITVTSA